MPLSSTSITVPSPLPFGTSGRPVRLASAAIGRRSSMVQGSFRFQCSTATSKNTAEQLSFHVYTGGGGQEAERAEGIHWHMIIDNTVTFAATDNGLQHIPWVSVKRADGATTVYTSTSSQGGAPVQLLARHTMDCMDCHNRPTHGFSIT